MATVRKMMQAYTEQDTANNLTTITPIDDMAGMFLDPTKQTIVREFTGEELGGMYMGLGPSTMIEGAFGPFVELRILPVVGERILEYMYAPSHVESPPIANAGGALLRVYAAGFSTSSGVLNAGRVIAAHAYIDEVD